MAAAGEHGAARAPKSGMDRAVRTWVRARYRRRHGCEFEGIDLLNEPAQAVVCCASMSVDDFVILAAFLPDNCVIIVPKERAATKAALLAARIGRVEVVDLDDAGSLRRLVRLVQSGVRVVTFPEARSSRTGGLDKILGWPATVADMAEAQIVPLRIDGAEYLPGSDIAGFARRRRVTLTLRAHQARALPLAAGLRGAARREALATALYDIMRDAAFDARPVAASLFQAVLDVADRVGGDKIVLEDHDRAPISLKRLILGAFVLGEKIARITDPGERVGVFLPNSVGGVVVFFALIAHGRVPAMLNFSAGATALKAAVETGPLRIVLSSRKFVEIGKLEPLIEAMASAAEIRWLDDIRGDIGLVDKLRGLFRAHFARATVARLTPEAKADDAGVVLFTSGSEGVPKGVVLSHANIQANAAQILAVADFGPDNVVFNPLPIFHSFGLTAGTLMPLLAGMKVVMYPSPLHYKQIPGLIHEVGATILFATDTFLSGYGRNSHVYDFRTIHSVVSGGEKVKPETRALWSDKHGVRIFEGYGATECAPVLSCNTPMHQKPGTVGRMFPRVEYRIEPVPGIERGGRLVVAGPNVMLGYLRHEHPGVLQRQHDRWYDTGDIVDMDSDGFVTILGRAKRFAKLGGEMVSLVAVESQVMQIWPDGAHAVVAVPDAKKGEALVLVTTEANPDVRQLLAGGRARGMPELMLPRTIIRVDEIPLLGSGKTDYVSVQKIALAKSVQVSDEPTD